MCARSNPAVPALSDVLLVAMAAALVFMLGPAHMSAALLLASRGRRALISVSGARRPNNFLGLHRLLD
jgi:hypothetical protein